MEKSTVANALQYMLERNRITAKELSTATGIPATTIYSMLGKKTSQADILTLKQIADYFGEDISIFCGLESYEKPIQLSDQERVLLSSFRGMTALGRERLLAYIEDIKDNPKYVSNTKAKT